MELLKLLKLVKLDFKYKTLLMGNPNISFKEPTSYCDVVILSNTVSLQLSVGHIYLTKT